MERSKRLCLQARAAAADEGACTHMGRAMHRPRV